ncbi:MAG: FAD:protein FMN transferase [Planctomycetota bacterium]|nr:FAD:protein FMN transferase [Planctomycetota bacterium]
MPQKLKRLIGPVSIGVLAVLVAVGLWKTGGDLGRGRLVLKRRPKAVMGTTCSLAVITESRAQKEAQDALDRAEAAIRAVEARTSCWIDDSEISRLARTPVGERRPLDSDTFEVLRAARQAFHDSGGAFDVTCGPLIRLWRDAAEKGRPPSTPELLEARAQSRWELIELGDGHATRLGPGARVDLGGIAKGHAIDRAVAILERAGLQGGLVDIGGDLACFGLPLKGLFWSVDIQNPFDSSVLVKLRLVEGAVCTSGDYARGIIIDGRRYSHIIDPGSGRPTETLPSVTIFAPKARTADIWATALSVLGPKGFERLPIDVEAMIVVGTPEDFSILATAGMHALLEQPLPKNITVWR